MEKKISQWKESCVRTFVRSDAEAEAGDKLYSLAEAEMEAVKKISNLCILCIYSLMSASRRIHRFHMTV